MNVRIVPATPAGIDAAAELLRAGDVVGIPTETVYGLAGDAFHEGALTRIFAVKERPTFDPLILHVSPALLSRHGSGKSTLEQLAHVGLVDAARLGERATAGAEALLAAFWPGPLTLVLPKLPAVPDLATSGLPTVAVRMPDHPVAEAVITAAGRPLAAPSANRFGRISPTSAADVAAELGDRIPLILDGGRCSVGVESTVLLLDGDGLPILLRPGGVDPDAIGRLLGSPVRTWSPLAAPGASPAPAVSPGLMASHYAPRKRLRLLPGPLAGVERAALPTVLPDRLGLLLVSGDPESGARRFAEVTGRRVIARTLSRSGDLVEAARNLFAELRGLDASEAEEIFAEPCSRQEGLGYAIGDRLRRASDRGGEGA